MVKIVNNIRINLKNDVFSLPAQVPEVIPLWEAFWEMQFTLFKRRTVNSFLLNFKCTFGRGGVNEEWATVAAVRFFPRGTRFAIL